MHDKRIPCIVDSLNSKAHPGGARYYLRKTCTNSYIVYIYYIHNWLAGVVFSSQMIIILYVGGTRVWCQAGVALARQ